MLFSQLTRTVPGRLRGRFSRSRSRTFSIWPGQSTVSRFAPRSMAISGPVRLMPRPSMWAGLPRTITLACSELASLASSQSPVTSRGKSSICAVCVSTTRTPSSTLASVNSPCCRSCRTTQACTRRPLMSKCLCRSPEVAGARAAGGEAGTTPLAGPYVAGAATGAPCNWFPGGALSTYAPLGVPAGRAPAKWAGGAVVNQTSNRSFFLMENSRESPTTWPSACKRSG